MNGEYIRMFSLEEFHKLALPYYKGVITKDLDLKKISELLSYQNRTFIRNSEQIDLWMEFTRIPLGPIYS